MAVVVAVIVLLTSVLSGLGLYTLTSRQTAIRQENLRAEAREIAYLASLYSGGSSTYTLGTSLFSGSAQNTVALKHLRWKAAQVYDEYGAYIAIVDRSGQVMDNMAVTYEKNPDFAKTLNGKDIYEALLTIIGGDEISIRRQVDGDWYFTVGVPFVSGGLVRGAVFIQTPAQEIEVRAGTLLLPVLGVVLGFCILAGSCCCICADTPSGQRAVRRGEGDVRGEFLRPRAGRKGDLPRNRGTERVVQHDGGKTVAIGGEPPRVRCERLPRAAKPDYGDFRLRRGNARRHDRAGGLSAVPDDYLRRDNAPQEPHRRPAQALPLGEGRRGAEQDEFRHLRAAFARAAAPHRRLGGEEDGRAHAVVLHDDGANALIHAHAHANHTAVRRELNGVVQQIDRHLLDAAFVRADHAGFGGKVRPHIFERFYTADKAHTSGKGTGLGLSICQRIMEMHGQKITLMDFSSVFPSSCNLFRVFLTSRSPA